MCPGLRLNRLMQVKSFGYECKIADKLEVQAATKVPSATTKTWRLNDMTAVSIPQHLARVVRLGPLLFLTTTSTPIWAWKEITVALMITLSPGASQQIQTNSGKTAWFLSATKVNRAHQQQQQKQQHMILTSTTMVRATRHQVHMFPTTTTMLLQKTLETLETLLEALERSWKWASSSWLQPSFASFSKCNGQEYKKGSNWHNHQAKVQLTTIKTFCWTNWITTDSLLNVTHALFCFVVESV